MADVVYFDPLSGEREIFGVSGIRNFTGPDLARKVMCSVVALPSCNSECSKRGRKKKHTPYSPSRVEKKTLIAIVLSAFGAMGSLTVTLRSSIAASSHTTSP
jgi:hypothetical protein